MRRAIVTYGEEQAEILTKKLDKPERPVPLKYLSGGQTSYNMLTDKEVRHIASLARIKINEKEEKGLKKDLSSILEYIDNLNEVNTDNVEPLYQTTGLVDSFRSDEPRGEFKINEDLNEKLIGQAPHSQNRFIKVKTVFERIERKNR